MEEERSTLGPEEAFAALMTAMEARGALSLEDLWPWLSLELSDFEVLADMLWEEQAALDPLLSLPFRDEAGMERFFRDLVDRYPEEKEAAQRKKKSPLYLYLQELEQTKPLSLRDAAAVWENAPDEGTAAAELTEGSLLFCLGIAQKFAGRGILLLDLAQEGSIELMLCAAEAGNGDFYLKAAKRIFDRMKELEEEMMPVSKVPQEQAEDLAQVVQAHRKLQEQFKREPTEAELAAETGLKPERVRELLAVETSLEKTDASLPETEEPDAAAVSEVAAMLQTLPETEARAVAMHFGLAGQPMTAQQIGEALHITPEEAQAALARGIKALQEAGT